MQTYTRFGFSAVSLSVSMELKAGGCNSSSRSFKIILNKNEAEISVIE